MPAIQLWKSDTFFFFLCLQTEVLGYLEKACQLVPDKGLSAECKEMVDSYFPILIGIIKGELVSTFEPFVQVITLFLFQYRFKNL